MEKKSLISKIKWLNIAGVIFVITGFLYLHNMIVTKSENIALANEIIRTQNEITVVKSEVDALTMNIKNLTDYSRVLDSIDASNMTNRNSTVITLGD